VPLFIQVHSIEAAKRPTWQRREGADLDEFGAVCLRHWVSEITGTAFCLAEAENADLARALHDGELGIHPERIHPVSERL
jgi:hypothetical protein